MIATITRMMTRVPTPMYITTHSLERSRPNRLNEPSRKISWSNRPPLRISGCGELSLLPVRQVLGLFHQVVDLDLARTDHVASPEAAWSPGHPSSKFWICPTDGMRKAHDSLC